MQKSGSNKMRVLYWCCAVIISPFVLIFIWSTYMIPVHEFAMMGFERRFTHIEHPQGARLIARYTHFGDGPYRAGSGNEICYSYVAEIRTIPSTFEDMEQYYEEHTQNSFLKNFPDATIEILPVSKEGMLQSRDYPINDLIEEYFILEGTTPTYIVYGVKEDERVVGDFRCWEI